MVNILIVYATTDGHTRKVASFIQQTLDHLGHSSTIYDANSIPKEIDLALFGAAILAGSVHQGKHQASLTHFAKKHVASLNAIPSLFISVSLTSITDDEKHNEEAEECISTFTSETGFQPKNSIPVAGALKYLEYDWIKRMLMKSIVKKEHGDIDTSKDYEYTDWKDLKAQILDFAKTISHKI